MSARVRRDGAEVELSRGIRGCTSSIFALFGHPPHRFLQTMLISGTTLVAASRNGIGFPLPSRCHVYGHPAATGLLLFSAAFADHPNHISSFRLLILRAILLGLQHDEVVGAEAMLSMKDLGDGAGQPDTEIGRRYDLQCRKGSRIRLQSMQLEEGAWLAMQFLLDLRLGHGMAQAVARLGSHAAPVALDLVNAAVARALFTGASRVGLREHDGPTAPARRRWLLNGHFAKLCGGKDRSFRRRLRCD